MRNVIDSSIQIKYLNRISAELKRFKTKIEYHLWNCRCPFCGDSEHNERKARGYFYWKDSSLLFKCHNCDKSTSFIALLKELYPLYYKDMITEVFNGNIREPKKEQPVIENPKPNFNIGNLKPFRMCKNSEQYEYLKSRKIPEQYIMRLLQVDNLKDFAEFLPKYKDRNLPTTKFVGIPYIVDNELAFIQFRNIDKTSKMRFVTMECQGGYKIYGLDIVDKSGIISVTEGAFDSMFVKNCISFAGVNNQKELEKLQGYKLRFIFDNDYLTNKQVRTQLLNKIKDGYPVVIFDNTFRFKDLNEAVLNGWDIDNLNEYLNTRTFSNLQAKLELKKVML